MTSVNAETDNVNDDTLDAYALNGAGSSIRMEGDEKAVPEWLKPIMANEKLRNVWLKLSLFTLVVNIGIITLFFFILFYNMAIQLLMIPELLGPIYAFGPVLIIFFCLFHSLLGLGWSNSLIYIILSVSLSWLWEELGVLSGIIFGEYSYSDLIPYHISYVPLEIPFSWFMYLYLTFCIADIIVFGRLHSRKRKKPQKKDLKMTLLSYFALCLINSIVVVGWDTVSDPLGSTGSGIWEWEHDNGYFFGVPLLNFFGWFWTSFCFTAVYLLAEYFNPLAPLHKLSLGHSLCPLVLYSGLMLYYVMLAFPQELGFIALFTMGLPIIVAVFRLLHHRFQPKPSLEGYDPILEASKSYDDFYREY